MSPRIVVDVRLEIETVIDPDDQIKVTELEWALQFELEKVTSGEYVSGDFAKVEYAEVKNTWTHPERFPHGVPDG